VNETSKHKVYVCGLLYEPHSELTLCPIDVSFVTPYAWLIIWFI